MWNSKLHLFYLIKCYVVLPSDLNQNSFHYVEFKNAPLLLDEVLRRPATKFKSKRFSQCIVQKCSSCTKKSFNIISKICTSKMPPLSLVCVSDLTWLYTWFLKLPNQSTMDSTHAIALKKFIEIFTTHTHSFIIHESKWIKQQLKFRRVPFLFAPHTYAKCHLYISLKK